MFNKEEGAVPGTYGEFLSSRGKHDGTDVDADKTSLHHTLGSRPTQAAPGNHKHKDLEDRITQLESQVEELETTVETLSTNLTALTLAFNGHTH